MVRHGIVLCAAGFTVVGAVSPATLRQAAEKRGIYMGTCINRNMLSDSQYTSLAVDQYSLVTAENACKWDAIEPNQGKFAFEHCDKIRDFALNTMGAVFRGHTLCWGNQLPDWVNGLNADQKREAIQNHGTEVIKHYGDDAIAWDVVNEAVIDDGDFVSDILKDNAWYPDVPDYIDVAFRAADAARKAGGYNVKLFYNDYGADSTTDKKSARVYQLVKGMVDRGVPIDGVGFQMHIAQWADNDGWYNGLKENMEQLSALGLEVHITELDIGYDSWSTANEQQQANMYARILGVCLEVDACKSFETWGFTDSRTWKTGQHPLPFDESYKPKKAVAAMVAIMEGGPAPAPAPPSAHTYETLETNCQNAVPISPLLSVSSVEECLNLCDAKPGCLAADTNGQSCNLKSHCEGTPGMCGSWCGHRLVEEDAVV